VRVAPITSADVPALRTAIAASAERIAGWGPTGQDRIDTVVAEQGPSRRTFLVQARDAHGAHGIAARVNLNHTVGGRMRSTVLGYDAYDPYAGHGFTREGLALVLDVVFAPEPDGLGLHRVEAGVQPGNTQSAGLLRSLGFVHEGVARRLLWLPSGQERTEDWRDHDRYAVLREDWPGAARVAEVAYRPERHRRLVCLVNGIPGSGTSTLARRLAGELGVPYLASGPVEEAVAAALAPDAVPASPLWLGTAASGAVWSLLAESPVGAVVETWAPAGRGARSVQEALRKAGLDPVAVPEVWCECPAGVAYPLGLGPVLRVDTSGQVSDREMVRLALAVRAAG
jgi:ribosomal-protein-alanine N-acetyltransferase